MSSKKSDEFFNINTAEIQKEKKELEEIERKEKVSKKKK